MMIGFTLFIKGKDVFFMTSKTRKTDRFASEILRGLLNAGYDIPDNREVRQEILRRIQKANCEVRTLSNGRKYYEISGNGFGGHGSFADDGNTVIIKL